MKILFARRGYSASGGAERYLTRLVTGLRERGIHTTLLTDGSWPQENWPGDHYERLKGTSPAEFSSSVSLRKDADSEALLFSFERTPDADIFRAGDGIHTAYLERQASEGRALASWFRKTRRHHRQTCALERELFTENKTLRVICNSQMVARELSALFAFPRERVSIIYNGFTPKPWDKAKREKALVQVRKSLNIPREAKIILFVGSGWKRKGAETLASAFKQLKEPEAHLLLVGKGKLKQAGHPRIHQTGPVRDPRDHYLAADLFALPTLYDPFSNACLEAAAYGIPVLTSDGNGFAEALRRFPGTGEIVPNPRNPERWKIALKSWIHRTVDASALEALVSAHTLDHNVSQTVDLLSTMT